MCTVTIVPRDDGGFRLVCNRDERRTRPEALPPRVLRLSHCTAVFPIDPWSGGTWTGVNDAGVAMAILNRKVHTDTERRTVSLHRDPFSRGVIIPALLACTSFDKALRMARAFAATGFEPFRLIVIQDTRIGVITNDGRSLSFDVSRMFQPLLFTSSSLGDAVVEEPRLRAFAELVLKDKSAWLRAQFRFHRSRWPQRPDLSVVMERADAATVSRTVVDVGHDVIDVDYEPLTDRQAAAVKVA